MKKNRNSFFNDNPYQNQMINPNMPNYNMGMPNQMMMPNFQDIEERLENELRSSTTWTT